jgi:hypothetical protein
MPPEIGHYICSSTGYIWPAPCCCIFCIQDEQLKERSEQTKEPVCGEWLDAEDMIEASYWKEGEWPLE